MAQLVDFSGLPARRRKRLAYAATALRPYVPAIAGEVTASIGREIPQYGRPQDPRVTARVSRAVEELIGHFVDLMERDVSSDGVLAYVRELGAGEAREGRTLDVWQASVRIGAGVAIGRLTEEAERLGLGGEMHEVGYIAREVFTYTDRVMGSVGEGHGEARAEGDRRGRRRALVDALLRDDPDLDELREVAARAGWPLPRSAAAVALGSAGSRPGLPPDALIGLHLDEPCAIVPDPEGTGRRRQLEIALDGWRAALGPAVGPDKVARSLSWARRALGLVDEGVLGADGLVAVTEHMPLLVMSGEQRELVDLVAERRLAPLREVRPALRRVLAETLLELIECRFNATVAASRLNLHAQTVRYRLRRLEELFGEALRDPPVQLELHMVLRARLAVGAI
ncbi:helix-turn-helix domain-containing protein [Spirillospora sp. NPDC052269]